MKKRIKDIFCIYWGLSKFFDNKSDDSIISVFDTSIASTNLGDDIINSSTYNELKKIFSTERFIKYPTHSGLAGSSIHYSNLGKYRFVCGTNLISSGMRPYNPNLWNMNWWDFTRCNPFILMGVGWGTYQKKIGIYSKYILSKILDKNVLHSVRDNYTKEKLLECGVENVINTGCPTMWNLTAEFCSKIPTEKSDNVIFSLTATMPKPLYDTNFINALKKIYKNIYFWPQGIDDCNYLKSLDVDLSEINFITPGLLDYDNLLASTEFDYVGSRLHGGIRALQNKRRTIIIAIDNRANEISLDTNLPSIEQNDGVEKLVSLIESSFQTQIKIKTQAIDSWKNQFKSVNNSL